MKIFLFFFIYSFIRKKKKPTNFSQFGRLKKYETAFSVNEISSKRGIALQNKYNYFYIPRPVYRIFWYAIPYQFHNQPCYHFTMRFFNIYYFFMIEYNADEYLEINYGFDIDKRRNLFFSFSKFFVEYFNFYIIIFNRFAFDNNNFLKTIKKRKTTLYHLILTCRNNKLFINLNDNLKINYLFLSTGLFIKYFDKKKLFKKNKTLRTVLIKYVRKMFLLIKFPQMILLLKKNPIFFLEFLNLLHQPILYKFNEPLTNREVVDDGSHIITNFLYFIFLNTENFTTNKTRKRGRVKRKIYRKIVSRNSIVD